jgi:hypothetical protein
MNSDASAWLVFVRRLPWTSIAVTVSLIPVLVAWPQAVDEPLELFAAAGSMVFIVDYKRAPDGTELLYTNAAGGVIGLSRRRPGGSWLLCWKRFDKASFDGEIEMPVSGTRAIVRRERKADFIHFDPPSTNEIVDWSLGDAEFCGRSAVHINTNPVLNDWGTAVEP